MQNKTCTYPAVNISAETGTEGGFYTVGVTGNHI